MTPIKTLCAMSLLTVAAAAQFTVNVPPGYSAAVGNSNNIYPWGRTSSSMRYQQVYDSSVFTTQNITYPILVQGMKFRPYPGTSGSWTGGTWSTLQVDMTTCPNDFLAASATFANNHGPDLTTVYSGPFTIAAGSLVGGGGVEPTSVDVALTTPFVYDPNLGDFLFEVIVDGATWTGGTMRGVDAASGATALGTRIYSTASHTATTGTVGVNYSLICDLVYVPAAGLYPAFNSDVRTGASPLTVNFTDASYSSDPLGVLSWAWDFDGDSVIDSTLPNPSFTYTSCGSYDVSLTVVDATHGVQTLTRTAYIVTDRVVADFSYAQIAPGVFQFTDLTAPAATNWAWDLDGDNVVDDTTQNPVYFYPNPCTGVNVTLTANRLCGPAVSASKQIVLSPNTLPTATAGGNGTSSTTAVGNVFDVQVTNPQGASICAVSMRPYTFTGPFNLSFYVSDGSYLDLVGGVVRHQVPSAWRLVGTGSGVSAGGTTATATNTLVALNNTVHLPQGDYCIALLITNPVGTAYVAYTTGSAANWGPFADANMVVSPNPTVAPGGAKYNLFGTGINSPRVWNGAFHYATHADDGRAQIGFAGSGCAGTAGQAALNSSGRPVLGTAMTLTATNLPLNAMIMVAGLGRYQPAPLDLTAFGAPNCLVRAAIDASTFTVGGNWTLNVPAAPAFSGLVLFNQAVVLDPAANALGVVLSDATGLVIGS